MSRSKALKLNMITSLLNELVILISGLILPRLILLNFGSASNGLVSSVLQFLGFSAILRAGIGGATRAALYKPLAEQDSVSINGIMVATNRHMKKIGAIIGIGIIIFSIVYPLIVRDEYEWFDAFSMVLIIGVGTFIDNFFGIKYKILHARIDLYYSNDKIYFGEITFFPASGFDANILPETDLYFGNLINLEEIQDENSRISDKQKRK